MDEQTQNLVMGKPISGSNIYKCVNRETIVTLMALGSPPSRIDVETIYDDYGRMRKRIVYTFDGDLIGSDKAKIFTGDLSGLVVSLVNLWGAQKSWDMVYSDFREKFLPRQ